MHHPTDRITQTTAFVTPVVEQWLEREIAQWVHPEGSIRRPIASRANALTTELPLAPIKMEGREKNPTINILITKKTTQCYLRLYSVWNMVMDNSHSERVNPLPRTLFFRLYTPPYREDNTHHGLCYISRGALGWTKNISMGPPWWGIDPMTHRNIRGLYLRATSRSFLPLIKMC